MHNVPMVYPLVIECTLPKPWPPWPIEFHHSWWLSDFPWLCRLIVPTIKEDTLYWYNFGTFPTKQKTVQCSQKIIKESRLTHAIICPSLSIWTILAAKQNELNVHQHKLGGTKYWYMNRFWVFSSQPYSVILKSRRQKTKKNIAMHCSHTWFFGEAEWIGPTNFTQNRAVKPRGRWSSGTPSDHPQHKLLGRWAITEAIFLSNYLLFLRVYVCIYIYIYT